MVTKTSGPSRPGARPRRSTCGAVRGCRARILQFAAGAIAVGLVCERHPVHGRVEHGVSLQRRRGGLSQAEALRRPGSVVISVGHGACLSHAPVATLRRFRTRPWPLCRSRSMSARYRAEFAAPGSQSAGYGRAVRKRELRAWRPRRPPASRRGCQFFQATVQGLRVCGRRNCERANTWSDHATVALPQ